MRYGIGIEAEMAPQLFELFRQGPSAVERSRGGLGIGLTLVRSLAEMHGGSVAAYSDGPGRGSEFVVRLPALLELRASSGAALPHAEKTDLSRAVGRRILVVEDNRDASEMLASLLRLDGHEVWQAGDGFQAVEIAERCRPEVILLDIGLPGRNGHWVAEQLRQRAGFGDTLIVAMTGFGQEQDRRRSKEAGFDHHLVKHVSLETIRDVLQSRFHRSDETGHT